MVLKIEPSLLKRHVFLFLGAIVAPCLVLVALSVRMIGQERQLQAKRASEERQRRVAQVGEELLSRLERIKLDLVIAPAKRVPETVVFVSSVRDGHLLLPWDANPNAQQFLQWIGDSRFANKMRQAEHEEMIAGKLDDAIRFYREALGSTPQPAAQAYARLSLARTLRKMGKSEDGYLEYKQVLDSSPDLADEHGIPLALYAAPPLLDAGRQQKEVLARITAHLNKSEWLPPAALYLLRDLAARLAAGYAVNKLTNQIQDREQAEALQRDFSRLLLLTQGQEPVWMAYGEPLWLVSLTPQAGSTNAMAIVVRAREMLTGRDSSLDQVELASGKTGEPLGEHFPGLRATIPAGVEGDDTFRRTFLLIALSLVVTLTLFAGYLLLRDVRRELRLAEMRSQFVSGVSHELKTPLTAIRVFAESMRLDDDMERQTQREYLDSILQESERLGRLVNNVLDFAKIEHGRKNYQLRPISLAEAADAAARIMRYPLEQSGFHLEVALDRDLHQVSADRDVIEQAILNLLNNAIKYSGESREIALRLFREGSDAVIQVVDHGVGIPREEQARIFERFYRVPSEENQRISGAGLGLTLVEHIVKAHGGSVGVESNPGEGSTFTIRLPLEDKS
jgi:signal transduction histidine kinase